MPAPPSTPPRLEAAWPPFPLAPPCLPPRPHTPPLPLHKYIRLFPKYIPPQCTAHTSPSPILPYSYQPHCFSLSSTGNTSPPPTLSLILTCLLLSYPPPLFPSPPPTTIHADTQTRASFMFKVCSWAARLNVAHSHRTLP